MADASCSSSSSLSPPRPDGWSSRTTLRLQEGAAVHSELWQDAGSLLALWVRARCPALGRNFENRLRMRFFTDSPPVGSSVSHRPPAQLGHVALAAAHGVVGCLIQQRLLVIWCVLPVQGRCLGVQAAAPHVGCELQCMKGAFVRWPTIRNALQHCVSAQ